jgi:hypothetical protein
MEKPEELEFWGSDDQSRHSSPLEPLQMGNTFMMSTSF